jgi:hypothetical protein
MACYCWTINLYHSYVTLRTYRSVGLERSKFDLILNNFPEFFFFIFLFYSVVSFPVFRLILTHVFTCVNFILPLSELLLQHILVSLILLLEQNCGNCFQCKFAHCITCTAPHLLQPVGSIYFS